MLLVSGVLAWLTTRLRRGPAALPRHPPPHVGTAVIPWRTRLRRPTMVLGSIVVLLGVALTATSFTWREHVTVAARPAARSWRASSAGLSRRPCTSRHTCEVPKLPMRPTVLEAKNDLPMTTDDGCISDFDNPDVVNCTYGDKAATRTIALAGGSHAEHWITALDLLGQHAPLQGGHLSEDGLPADHGEVPLIMGNNRRTRSVASGSSR